MVKTGFSVLILAVCANVSAAAAADAADLASPDRHIRVAVQTGEGGRLQYTVTRDGKPVLLASQLGLQLEGAELSSGLTVVARSAPRPIREHYDMAVGKRRSISYRADPMDFTPMVFGDIPNIRRSSSNGFELATAVLYLSGIQHFAETPEGMASVPAYVRTLLQELPRSWDDSRLLDLSFAGKAQGVLITDGATARSFNQSGIAADKQVVVTIKPHGGFVIQF